MDLGFSGASAVVAGGTQGMGFAAAMCMAADGAKVGVLARTQADLDRTVEALLEAGAPDAVGLRADLRDRASVDAAFAEVGERWGSINALVNTTGSGNNPMRPFYELDDEEFIDAVEIICLSHVRTVRAALPLLRAADWARVVNVSAHSTKRQHPGLVAYTAAKAMLTSVTKNMSQTLAPEEILVNTVSPGSFATETFRAWVASTGADGTDLYACMRAVDEHFGHPAQMPRAADPSEIGPVIAFAASRRNTYMTGANLNVDGGSDFC